MNLISKHGSAFCSLSLLDTCSPTNRETAHHEIEQVKRPKGEDLKKTVVKKDQQEEGEQQLLTKTLSKEIREKDETRLKTGSMHRSFEKPRRSRHS